jgi:hypothetical protein
MATTRQIINDMRAQARAIDGRHLQGRMMCPTARALRRGADELERLLDELFLLRAFAEIETEGAT